MKTRLKFVAAVFAAMILTLVSCEKTQEVSGTGICNLTVRMPGLSEYETKVTGQSEANEKHICNCQVFVFRDDNGKVDASGYFGTMDAGGSCSVDLNCTVGKRHIWVLVNTAGDYTLQIEDEQSLKALYTELKDNSKNALFMVGSDLNANLNEGACTVNIGVKRLAATIVLQNLTIDMESKSYRKPGVFKLQKVYLLNVCARTSISEPDNVSGTITEDYWYARLSEETDSSRKGLVSDDLATPVLVDNGSSHSTSYTFYAYPNKCPHSVTTPFSPRATLLVVEAELDGEKYYYPLSFEKLESNHRYAVSITIKRPGSKNPYEPVLYSAASTSITVDDWDEGDTRNETI